MDMQNAYKQLAVHPDQWHLTVIAIFDRESLVWRFVIAHALPFELSGSVLLFIDVRRDTAAPSSQDLALHELLCKVCLVGCAIHSFERILPSSC